MSDPTDNGWKSHSPTGDARFEAVPLPKRRSTLPQEESEFAMNAATPPPAPITASRLDQQKPKKNRSWVKRIALGLLIALLAAIIIGSSLFLFAYSRVSIPAPSAFATAEVTRVYYADGETEIGSFSEVNRTVVDAATLPPYVGNAIVASEDRTFYTNSGIDLKGIVRAVVTNLRTGSRQGGSTLSQQYVENYYVGETTTDYRGKLREAILALKINRTQSKQEILANYMNTIYFGRGAYGIEAASQAYFGIPAQELNLSQAAMLAGIIPAPSLWDPAVDPEMAQTRWARVLELMVEDGWATQAEADAAVFPETIPPNENSSSMQGITGHLMQQVRSELIGVGGLETDRIEAGGWKIITTLDPNLQKAAEEAVQYLPEDTPEEVRVALSSVDNATGAILAEYPGSDYQKIQTNAVTQDIAMAGSAFKPFALLNAVQQGGSVYDRYNGNSPLEIEGVTVSNNDGYSFGQVDMVEATRFSINTAFVELNSEYGAAQTMETLVAAGIPEETVGLEPTLLNVLGFAAPHNIDLVRAFSTLANGGEKITPHMVARVEDSQGNKIYEAVTTRERVFSVENVSGIMPALQAVTTEGGTGEKVNTLGREIGGKTGTSEEQKSAQFVGFTPQITTAVSMYGVSPEGDSIPLPNIGGLGQFHGSDWPVDVWLAYMDVATEGMENSGFAWLTQVVKPAPVGPPPTQAPSPTPTPTVEPEPIPTQEPEPEPTPEPEPEPEPEPTPPGPPQPARPDRP